MGRITLFILVYLHLRRGAALSHDHNFKSHIFSLRERDRARCSRSAHSAVVKGGRLQLNILLDHVPNAFAIGSMIANKYTWLFWYHHFLCAKTKRAIDAAPLFFQSIFNSENPCASDENSQTKIENCAIAVAARELHIIPQLFSRSRLVFFLIVV